jgi:SAM-dependent methyltransferase
LFFADNTHGRQRLSPDTFGVYECEECKVVFIDLAVTPGYYEKFYAKNYYEKKLSGGIASKLVQLLERLSDVSRLGLIRKSGITTGKILEIGCGEGRFIHRVPHCFEKYAIEINELCYAQVKEHYPDITVSNAKLDDDFIRRYGCFDVVVMWHVFEHVEAPRDFVEKLSRLMKKNGIIIFDIPNRNSLGFRWTGKNWFHLDAPRHLFCYGHASIKALFERSGFTVTRCASNPFDYFHDLAVSVCLNHNRDTPAVTLLWVIFISPFLLLLRILCAVFVPQIAEINTYVIRKK